MDDVQTEIGHEIAALARDLRRMNTAEACDRIARLRRRAAMAGFAPTAALADGLGRAFARDRHDTPLAAWLDALALAAGCGAGNAHVERTLLATVGVRMAG